MGSNTKRRITYLIAGTAAVVAAATAFALIKHHSWPTGADGNVALEEPQMQIDANAPAPEADAASVLTLPSRGASSNGSTHPNSTEPRSIHSDPTSTLPENLSTAALVAALDGDSLGDVSLIREALDRVQRCSRFAVTRGPQFRQRRLKELEDNSRSTEDRLRLWSRQDEQCPGLNPDLKLTALGLLTELADSGNFEAQALYYERGRLPMAQLVQNPAAATAYVERMKNYLEPIMGNPEPENWDLLYRVHNDGGVYPSDYFLSAMYRFASHYMNGLSMAELDERRIGWGYRLTDAQIDAAEQAGYQLFLACCGP